MLSQICGKMSEIVWLIALKNIILKIWTSRGNILTQFVTQFTHVSGHPRISSRRQKNGLGKTVLKVWFLICYTMTYLSKKVLKKNNKKHMKPSTIFGQFFGEN
jgi:hypothetical protein